MVKPEKASRPGPEPDRLSLPPDWEENAKRIVRKPYEPGTVKPAKNPRSKASGRKPKAD